MHLSPLFSSKKIDSARFQQRAFFCPGDIGAELTFGVAFQHTHRQNYPESMQSHLSAPPPSSIDWTRTELGDEAAWPAGLRLTIDIMFNTPLAMLLMWGREQVMVFNPAYADLCGTASHRAPGGKVPSVPPPAWHWNPAAIAAAWDGVSSHHRDQSLPLWREAACASSGSICITPRCATIRTGSPASCARWRRPHRPSRRPPPRLPAPRHRAPGAQVR